MFSSSSRPTEHLALWRILVAQELAVRYRGTLLGLIWPLMLPVLMLAVYGFVFGAVFFPRSMVPPPLAGAVNINPISWPTEALRASMLHGQWSPPGEWMLYSLVAVAVLLLGALVFKMLRPGFADVL